jgi:NADPH:quinone reductase-like Zn-dependent oxidoreductase
VPRPSPGEALVRVHAAAITRDELSWPAIDSVFALEDAVAAFTRVAQRGKRGKVVLRVTDDGGDVPTP